jgi:hypothetical protein
MQPLEIRVGFWCASDAKLKFGRAGVDNHGDGTICFAIMRYLEDVGASMNDDRCKSNVLVATELSS